MAKKKKGPKKNIDGLNFLDFYAKPPWGDIIGEKGKERQEDLAIHMKASGNVFGFTIEGLLTDIVKRGKTDLWRIPTAMSEDQFRKYQKTVLAARVRGIVGQLYGDPKPRTHREYRSVVTKIKIDKDSSIPVRLYVQSFGLLKYNQAVRDKLLKTLENSELRVKAAHKKLSEYIAVISHSNHA